MGAMFMGFLLSGLISFGGAMPMVRRMIVEERRWMTAAEFNDMLALCQFLPGGNIINVSAAVGLRFHGLPGAVVGIAGLLAAPVTVVIVLGLLTAHFHDRPVVHHLFAGLAAAAAGLIIATAVKLIGTLRGDPLGLGIVGLCFVATGVLRLPLLSSMLVLAPLSVLLTWRFRK